MDSDYNLLNVSYNASLEKVTKRYHILAKKVHPDKQKLPPNTAHTKFIELNNAYRRIKQDILRRIKIKNDEKYIAKIKAQRKKRMQHEKREQERKRRRKERERYLIQLKMQQQKIYEELREKERKERSPFKYNYQNPRDSQWQKK